MIIKVHPHLNTLISTKSLLKTKLILLKTLKKSSQIPKISRLIWGSDEMEAVEVGLIPSFNRILGRQATSG